MEFRSKSFVVFSAIASLFSGVTQAAQPGNIRVQYPNGANCGGFTLNDVGVANGLTYAMNLGNATIFNNNFFYMPILLGAVQINYQANFNMTQSTYQLIAPGVNNPVLNRTGTFTGSITPGALGGFNISLSLDCGVTLTGTTLFAG